MAHIEITEKSFESDDAIKDWGHRLISEYYHNSKGKFNDYITNIIIPIVTIIRDVSKTEDIEALLFCGNTRNSINGYIDGAYFDAKIRDRSKNTTEKQIISEFKICLVASIMQDLIKNYSVLAEYFRGESDKIIDFMKDQMEPFFVSGTLENIKAIYKQELKTGKFNVTFGDLNMLSITNKKRGRDDRNMATNYLNKTIGELNQAVFTEYMEILYGAKNHTKALSPDFVTMDFGDDNKHKVYDSDSDDSDSDDSDGDDSNGDDLDNDKLEDKTDDEMLEELPKKLKKIQI
jgi:hypothetical protein